jgi:hypothetical protein
MNAHFDCPLTTTQEKALRKLQRAGFEVDYQNVNGSLCLVKYTTEPDGVSTEVVVLYPDGYVERS